MMHYLSIDLFALMPMLFFIYGLSFFVLGASIAVEKLSLYRSSPSIRLLEFVRSAWGSLALFGLFYALYEFMGAFNILYGGVSSLKILRFIALPASFYFLCRFGVFCCREFAHKGMGGFRRPLILPDILAIAWVVFCLSLLVYRGPGDRWFSEMGTVARYVIGIPGCMMAAFALASSRKEARKKTKKYLLMASAGFVLFAAGLLITSKADMFSMSVLNYEAFYRMVHVPVMVYRMACTVFITFALLMFFQLSRDFVSLRFKAILHVIIAVAIPAFCVILLVTYLMAHSLIQLSYRDNEKITAQTGLEIGTSLRDMEDRIKYDLLFARDSADMPIKEGIKAVFMETTDLTGVTFFDKDGEILRAVKDPSTGAITYTGTTEGLRINSLLSSLTPQAALADFHIAGRNGQDIILEFPMPGGRIRLSLDLEKLFSLATRDLRMEKGWHVVLLDDKGRLVLHGGGGHMLEKAAFESPGLNRGQYGDTTVEKGVLRNAIEVGINGMGWYLITEIPRKEIAAPVFNVFKGLIVGLFVIGFLAMMFAGLVVDRVIRPINLVAERVKSIGRGDLAPAVGMKTGDEIQTLSEEVEKMAVMLVEKREAEKRMMQTQKIATLGHLVSGVAHEINNPLSVILWSSELLLRQFKPGERTYEDLKLLEKHALACKKIVDDLLRFSRTGKQVDVAVDINRNIEETLSLTGKLTRGSDVSVALDFDPSLPKVKGDPDKLRQVFLNLAVNAVDAMKKGGGTLTVRTSSSGTGPERSVEVTFADTGCGMSHEDMERIFDPFFTTKKEDAGTGLGLSVSYGIITDHHGRMWAESAPGKGSTFYIVLPAMGDSET